MTACSIIDSGKPATLPEADPGTSQSPSPLPLTVICEKCNQGAMVRRDIRRFSGVLIALANIVIVVAVGSIAITVLGGLAMVLGAGTLGAASAATAASAGSDAATGGAVLGAGMATGMVTLLSFATTVLTFFAAVPSLIVGLLLLSRRRVRTCSRCGYLYDVA